MDHPKQIILRAFRLIFRPVAGILLRAGIQWKEVAAVGKAIYVDVASREFGIRGRPTNTSRIAILTGFTRREVARLKKLLADDQFEENTRLNHATRVLTGWYTDPEFSTPDGEPRPLADDGPLGFASLCRRFASDVPATTLRKELLAVGAVEELEDGRLIARSRYYMPTRTDPMQVLSSGSVLEDLGTTVQHNLFRGDNELPRFERRATNTLMPASAVAPFQAFLETEAQAFLERVDGWLTEHEQAGSEEGERVRLGLGAYFICNPIEPEAQP